MTDLIAARQQYAETICQRAGVRSAAVVHAFATVAREHYLGPGPWQIFDPGAFNTPDSARSLYRPTPNADPIHLYQDALIAIDTTRFLNNGQPSAHALWIDALDPHQGDHLVHIGCGTGYFTAVMAEIVGSSGRVTAIEIDPELASRARTNLAGCSNVQVVEASGCTFDFGAADAIYINAGATHPLPLWLDRLDVGGRLTVPLVRWPGNPREASASGCGVLIKVTRDTDGYAARVVSLVGIFPCIGAVDPEADQFLSEAFARGIDAGQKLVLRRDQHGRRPACWLHGDGYCFAVD